MRRIFYSTFFAISIVSYSNAAEPAAGKFGVFVDAYYVSLFEWDPQQAKQFFVEHGFTEPEVGFQESRRGT